MDIIEELLCLSLCTGGAGLDLGVEIALPTARTVCYVEIEAFAIHYLVERMQKGFLAEGPIWTDLKTFDGRPWRRKVHILLAGYPCQPFSVAGKRRGKVDPRHLWPDMRRVIGEVESPIVFMENVAGHLTLGFAEVSSGLEGMGYQVAAGLFTAREVGAPQERERLFILAVADSCCKGLSRRKFQNLSEKRKRQEASRSVAELCNSLFPPGPDEIDEWVRIAIERPFRFPLEPKVHGVVDGLASSYLKIIGNGVVPLQAAYAFLSLWSSFWDD